jgi:hypothetical protein
MIFEEGTMYVYQTVQGGAKELDKGFAVADTWRVMLTATNDDEVIEMRVRRMNADEARRARTSESRRENGHRATRAASPITVTTIPGR